MAIVNQPTPLSNELAWNGDKNPIPDTNDGSKGLFSIEYGFPYVTQQPLAQGGIPPQRNDFNGVLNLLSKFIRYFQNGGVFAYNASMDYSVGMLVRSGDRLYVCKAENGANTTAGVQGVSNSNYWNEITLEDTLGNTLADQLKTVLVTEAEAASNTVDWNTLTESRTYKISGATFSSTYHQPVGANGNGELVVLKNGTDTIVQVYYANSVQASQAGAFHRIYFNGTWTEWVYDITNKGGKIDGSLTLSGDLTADNITANGDLSVTGNSTINGKLTVDSLDIKNNFTVAGGTPVTGEDLQKVQDQIIAPTQTIFVSNSGSDETGDGTRSKPYKTIDKAGENIKEGVPSIIIRIIDDTGTIPFYISKCIRPKTGNTSLTITGDSQEYNINQSKRIQIYVNPSSYFDYTYQEKTWNVYGYFIAFGWEDITISALEIHSPTGITAPSSSYNPDTEKYNRQLFRSNNLTIKYSLITLNNNCLWLPGTSDCFLSNVLSTINQQSDFYIINAYFNRFTEEDETVRPVAGTFSSITSIINSENGNFTGNTSKLLTSNCHCIYKNF